MKNLHTQGFTLIEIMIVVAIVAILGSIGYPSYVSQTQKGWRSEGKSAALAAAQQEERYFTMNNSYVVSAGANPAAIQPFSCAAQTVSCRYNVSVVAGASGILTSYIVRLVPNGWIDNRCGTLTLTSDGTRGSTGSWSVAQCWN